MSAIASNLQAVMARIASAAKAAGRAPESVQLLAVSKTWPLACVLEAAALGQRLFGENYVQESAGKWPAWRLKYPEVKLHMIGPLQTNKAKVAVEIFDAIHTVDRPSLAERLIRLADTSGLAPEVFIQVNTGAEPQKAGILPDQTDDFVSACRAMGLPVVGLMCIPPEDEHPAPHFTALADMAARNGLTGLSMGMSSDFETAIEHGATHIRVGSAIFCSRSYR